MVKLPLLLGDDRQQKRNLCEGVGKKEERRLAFLLFVPCHPPPFHAVSLSFRELHRVGGFVRCEN